MIFRPVNPASPWGPPITNRPDGLRWKMVRSFKYLAGMTGLITCLQSIIGAALKGGSVLGFKTTTVMMTQQRQQNGPSSEESAPTRPRVIDQRGYSRFLNLASQEQTLIHEADTSIAFFSWHCLILCDLLQSNSTYEYLPAPDKLSLRSEIPVQRELRILL